MAPTSIVSLSHDRTGNGNTFSSVQDAWMRNHPGSTMTIYDIPGQAKEAWPLAATPTNIMSGFRVSGIYPFNINVFGDEEYSPCYVTDRPPPGNAPNPSSSTVLSSIPTKLPSTNESMNSPTEASGISRSVHSSWENINNYLRSIGKEVIYVEGDGHCLLRAVEKCITIEGIGTVTHDGLCESLVSEIRNNIDYYDDFSAVNQADVIADIENYVYRNVYNTDTVNMVLSALCNVLGVSAIVYRFGNDGLKINAIGPGRPGVVFNGDIHLVLSGEGACAHYNALKDSHHDEVFTAIPLFTPERIRPHPKAPPRKGTHKGRAKKKSAILTDTPEKNKIEADLLARAEKKKKSLEKGKPKTEPKGKPTTTKRESKMKRKPTYSESSDDHDEWFCLVCTEPYSNSVPGEGWTRCVGCRGWSHEECTGLDRKQVYVCQNYDSDDDLLL